MSDQDYEAEGFNQFMSRSIDSGASANLDSPTPPVNTQAFDRTQVSGAQGDSYRIGKITLNGSTGTITANDGDNDFFLLGAE